MLGVRVRFSVLCFVFVYSCGCRMVVVSRLVSFCILFCLFSGLVLVCLVLGYVALCGVAMDFLVLSSPDKCLGLGLGLAYRVKD